MKLALANIAWLSLVVLFYALLPEWREVLFLAIPAAILWRIHEIAPHRPDWSWLNKWPWLLKLEARKMTGYHLTAGIARILLLSLFFVDAPNLGFWEALAQGLLLLALLGYTDNHFYHVALMYSHEREYDMLLHGLIPNSWRKFLVAVWSR